MGCCNGEGSPINSFALVSYVPEPLGSFLDRLRVELVLGCHAKSHVTALPPRPLNCEPLEAWLSLQSRLQDFPAFRVELGPVEMFPVTQVIYLAVRAGAAELREMHTRLNEGCLAFEEPFEYHPHVTLAQDLDPAEVAAVFETAQQRWADFKQPRSFIVDRLTFVQNTLENRWTDLNAFPLTTTVTI